MSTTDRTTTWLCDPRIEHDACGVGFVVDVKGVRSHRIVEQGLEVLRNLTHRGACGCDPLTGDGAGILVQIPDAFLRREAKRAPHRPARAGRLRRRHGVPAARRAPAQRVRAASSRRSIREEGQKLLGWRRVPVDAEAPGPVARSVDAGRSARSSSARGQDVTDQDALERKLYVIRKRVEQLVRDVRACRESRALLRPEPVVAHHRLQGPAAARADAGLLPRPDRPDVRLGAGAGAPALLAPTRSRRGTARIPYRFIAHNGEINTLRGNVNWMHARQAMFASPLFGDDVASSSRSCDPAASDSGTFDNALELLVRTGRSLPHAVMMMIPEAWQNHESMSDDEAGVLRVPRLPMEPWDGPASIAFTDGRVIGAMLDRNGLRPSRYVVTKDGLVVMASEVGVLDIAPENVEHKDRLQPGRMFLVDTEQGRIVDDDEIKEAMAARKPYRQWLDENLHRSSSDLPAAERRAAGVRRPTRCSPASRPSATRIEDLRHPDDADGAERPGARRLDGHRHAAGGALGPAAAALHLLQAALRPGDQPADRPDPRGAGHVARRRPSAPSRTCSRRRPSTAAQLELKSPILTNEELAQLQGARRRRRCAPSRCRCSSRSQSAATGLRDGARRAVRAARPTRSPTAPRILILSDRGVDERPRADPEPARDGRGAPPPDPRGHPHALRHRRRVGRAARGAALLPAARLRRRRRESLPRVRDDARHGAPRACCKDVDVDEARRATTSRRSTRACSR